jgi:hypothetical protein
LPSQESLDRHNRVVAVPLEEPDNMAEGNNVNMDRNMDRNMGMHMDKVDSKVAPSELVAEKEVAVAADSV